jgi:surface antigen
MNSLLAVAVISFKNEIRIALVSLGVVVSLPIIALFSVTNVAALKDQTVTLYTAPISPTNGYAYDFGFCTYWVALRREQTGHPIPSYWGNANTWDDKAKSDGYLVDHSPAVGAIMQTDVGPLGHVAFVEGVALNGSWTISEMNFRGWDEVDSRSQLPAAGVQYDFIH